MSIESFFSVQADLAKIQCAFTYRFSRNDGLDTERYLLNRPHYKVKQSDAKPELQMMP